MSWKCLSPGRANSANWRARTLTFIRCSASSCHFAPGAPMGKPERSECAQKVIAEHRTIEWSTYSFPNKGVNFQMPLCQNVRPHNFRTCEMERLDNYAQLA